ncbi:Dfg16p KNAG_0B03170 [Huiozyma naganishii CBS 8797]|uniref:Uncharacterized protein n=1 Tax=Huiozyma naganishii (strain ATCC MYA-139 / BCRC 22969 / CBS 8797 / KCTC 17520 / NBRC 10181 / NCYC 3082 / Yp74L-3) TaxID=1071383 RepID=J7RGU2_HUIN7|nr:hypothetical protein KNAG_0B03170 [Kazachstania naganishii CBS 8797]CCK68758.1 hypothetical protein KNAG_0B03170 [Kazachstania naganishii CBS 8797]
MTRWLYNSLPIRILLLLTLHIFKDECSTVEANLNFTDMPMRNEACPRDINEYFGLRPPSNLYCEHSSKANKNLTLSQVLSESLLKDYPSNCHASILGSGFLSIYDNMSKPLIFNNERYRNWTIAYPTLLIQCTNRTYNATNIVHYNETFPSQENNFTAVLKEFVHNYTMSMDDIYDDTERMVYKDKFVDGILIITFSQTAVCVASWMVFLIILFLPANNYNTKLNIVKVYVLLFALVQSVYLQKASAEVFRTQYMADIQDASYYKSHIMDSVGYRICEVFIHVMGLLNWWYIIYFMFHLDSNQKRKKVEHKNHILSTIFFFLVTHRNVTIFTAGVFFLVTDTIFFTFLLWNETVISLRVLYKVSQLSITTMFLGLVGFFLSQKFHFVLEPKRSISQSKPNMFEKLKNMWRNYYDTIPILIYNLVLIVLLYFTSIFFSAKNFYISSWKYNIVYFMKLLITVNFWGLISVLRKREATLNRKTILGRKIQNSNKYFVNPHSNYDLGVSNSNGTSSILETSNSSSMKSTTRVHEDIHIPNNTWKSHISKLNGWKKMKRREKM